jgi:hypothetical protein
MAGDRLDQMDAAQLPVGPRLPTSAFFGANLDLCFLALKSHNGYQPVSDDQHYQLTIFKNERQKWSAANLGCAARADFHLNLSRKIQKADYLVILLL